MSFSITTAQFRARTKTVTRRLGWADLRRGAVVMGIEKGMGLSKGERQVELGPIRVLSNRAERLDRMVYDPRYGKREAALEGFPEMSGREFVRMFVNHNKCEAGQKVRRIEFEHL